MRAERSGLVTGARLRLLAAVLLTSTSSACVPLDNALAALFGRTMRDQPSFDPYENTRPPAVGSIPFATGNLQVDPYATNLGQPIPVEYDLPSFTNSPADLMGIAAPLQNPIPADQASLDRGKLMFERYCAPCHGLRGISAEAPLAAKHPLMPAFNLAMGAATTYTDGYIYGMIRVGRGLMPSYGHQVPHFDRWHIVNYVRQLQRDAAGGAPPAAPAAPAAPGAGPGGN
jgi:mono/diheme cytochrome c family protein